MIKISDTEYYSNDKTIRFLNMDCNEFMKKCNPAIFDLAVIDSPYGIGEDGSKNHTRSKIATSKNYKAYQSTDNDSPTIETFNNIIYVSKNQIILYLKFLMIVLVGLYGIKIMEKLILLTAKWLGLHLKLLQENSNINGKECFRKI